MCPSGAQAPSFSSARCIHLKIQRGHIEYCLGYHQKLSIEPCKNTLRLSKTSSRLLETIEAGDTVVTTSVPLPRIGSGKTRQIAPRNPSSDLPWKIGSYSHIEPYFKYHETADGADPWNVCWFKSSNYSLLGSPKTSPEAEMK